MYPSTLSSVSKLSTGLLCPKGETTDNYEKLAYQEERKTSDCGLIEYDMGGVWSQQTRPKIQLQHGMLSLFKIWAILFSYFE